MRNFSGAPLTGYVCGYRRAAPSLAALALAVVLALGGCAGTPQQPPAPQGAEGRAIAAMAASLVGTPYHFGGADDAGFDCSGLALYVHERVGLVIPRTAAEQQRTAHPVPLAQLAPGDLVFFDIRGHAIDHVGIYAGDGRFIHAPRAGLAVTYGDLGRGFYARHLASAGRFWDSTVPSR
jgi:cell wall-associated NlpC family hydrolase